MAENIQKKSDILKSAEILFRKKGFHNTKMEEVATSAGVGKGTIYDYFSGKQDVFDKICIRNARLIYQILFEINIKDICFKDKLRFIIKNTIRAAEFDDISMESIFSDRNILSEDALKAVKYYASETYKILNEIISQGKSEGNIRKDVSSIMVSSFIIGAIGEYYRVNTNNKYLISDEDSILNLFLYGFSQNECPSHNLNK